MTLYGVSPILYIEGKCGMLQLVNYCQLCAYGYAAIAGDCVQNVHCILNAHVCIRAAFRISSKGGGGCKIAIYIFHWGRIPNCTCKVYHNLGRSGGAPPGNFFDFEHPDITSGAFLDEFSSYQFIA